MRGVVHPPIHTHTKHTNTTMHTIASTVCFPITPHPYHTFLLLCSVPLRHSSGITTCTAYSILPDTVDIIINNNINNNALLPSSSPPCPVGAPHTRCSRWVFPSLVPLDLLVFFVR